MTEALILRGSKLAKQVRAEVAEGARRLTEETGIVPVLAAILAGDNSSSAKYVEMKAKACADAGIGSRVYPFSNSSAQSEVEACLKLLNEDPSVHGILIQHPLPKHMDEPAVLLQLSPDKDVDGIAPISLGRLASGLDGFRSCTPAGMIEVLKRYDLPIAGKHAVVVGRSVILGKPLALLLLNENATVTICHSRTSNLAEVTRTGDILCACVGKPEMITGDMIKPGAVVLDAGHHKLDGGDRVVGDVHFESAAAVASAITPVPGSIGPMTIAMLLRNTLTAAQRAAERQKARES